MSLNDITYNFGNIVVSRGDSGVVYDICTEFLNSIQLALEAAEGGAGDFVYIA